MTKQELARHRNWFKYIVSGKSKPVDLKALTEWEQEKWATLLNIRDELLDKFAENSKNLGLNVKDRCWCGKIANHIPTNYPMDYRGKVCKNHINYD